MVDVTEIDKMVGGSKYYEPSQFDDLITGFIESEATSPEMRKLLLKLQSEVSPRYKAPDPPPRKPVDTDPGEGTGSQKTVFAKFRENLLTPKQQLAIFGQAPHSYFPVYERVVYPPSYSMIPRTVATVQQGEPIPMDTSRPLPIDPVDPIVHIGKGTQPPPPDQISPIASALEMANINLTNISSGLRQPIGLGIGTNVMPGLQSALITGIDVGQTSGIRQAQSHEVTPRLRMPTMLQPKAQAELAKIPPRPPSVPPVWYGAWLDSLRKKPRKQRLRKRRKRKLWWDVPYQPLGEPWSAKEYVVFTGGEPGKVKKKEKTKGLDDWGWFKFAD